MPSPAVVATAVALLMCVDTIRVAVKSRVDLLTTFAVSRPQLVAGAIVLALVVYLVKQLRSLSAPLVDVPLTEEEANPVIAAPAGVTPGTIRHDAFPGRVLCWDPSTHEFLGTMPAMDAAQVQEVVSRARAAQEKWARTSFAERRKVMAMINAAMLHRQDEVCQVSSRDSGKTHVEGLLGEVMTTSGKIAWINGYGEEVLKPSYRATNIMFMHKSARVEYHPVGVLGVIAPWNYPFHNLLNHIISGLFAGNAVVSKVSEHTSWSGKYYLRLVREVLAAAGHSPELVQIVTGHVEAGAGLVASDVDKIIFTGSPQVGKHIMAGCARTLKPVVLELGGKDPSVVCEDADMGQVTAYAMRGAFQNCGQNCIGIERLYVYEQVYDELLASVTRQVQAFVQGPPLEGCTDVGAMTMPGQIDIIQELVDDAVAKGAQLVIGGKRASAVNGGKGQFYQPTILAGVTHEMRIANEEVFGPVLTIFKITGGDEELLRVVNATPYGLGSSIFTKDLARAERLQRHVRAGMTCINDFGINYLAQSLPFGGVGISGFGRFSGEEGLRACCNMKSIITDRVPGIRTQIPAVLQYPMTAGSEKFAKGLIGFQFAPTIMGRIRGILDLITAKPTPAKAKQQ